MKRYLLVAALLLHFARQARRMHYGYGHQKPASLSILNQSQNLRRRSSLSSPRASTILRRNRRQSARFKKVIKFFPKSAEAAEAQYFLGLIEEEKGNLYEAFQAYQKVIDTYPFSSRITDLNKKEYDIGEKFLGGLKRKAMGMPLPVENPALEIFHKVVDNSTYGPLAPKAQYKIGVLLKGEMQYYDAEEAFNKVIPNYPDSEWVEAAKFQIAACRAALSRGPDYDQGSARGGKG